MCKDETKSLCNANIHKILHLCKKFETVNLQNAP